MARGRSGIYMAVQIICGVCARRQIGMGEGLVRITFPFCRWRWIYANEISFAVIPDKSNLVGCNLFFNSTVSRKVAVAIPHSVPGL